MCGMKGEKLKMPYRDAFTGKTMIADKKTIQMTCFMLMNQYPKEEFIIEVVN